MILTQVGQLKRLGKHNASGFFDILTFSYIFQRLEKRGRGRGTYLRLIILKKKKLRKTKQGNTSQERSIIEAAASVISSIKDNEELASK